MSVDELKARIPDCKAAKRKAIEAALEDHVYRVDR